MCGGGTLQLISTKLFHAICFYVEVKSTRVDLYRLLVELTSASCEDVWGMYPPLFTAREFGRLPKHLAAHSSRCICEGWASKGTQQGGDKVVDFIHFSTLIVYKCPFKSCHTPAAPCIFDGNGRAGCGKAASGRKLAARFEREWTPLRNKCMWQRNIPKSFLEFDELNGANPHQVGWILVFVFIHDYLISALSDDHFMFSLRPVSKCWRNISCLFSVLKRLWSALAKLTEDMSNLNVLQKSNHPYILAIIRFSLSKPLATRPYPPNVKIQPENLHPFQGFSHLGEVVLMAYLAL